MRVAIQGIRGSFHAQAATDFFKDQDIELVECMTFRDVFDAVKQGTAERGVVAVENSLQGPINPVYSLLAKQKLWICGEVRLRIALCLVAAQPQDVSLLNKPSTVVSSHFAALGQCQEWLYANLPLAKQQEGADTAAEVVRIVAANDDTQLAIASQYATELHGGVVIQSDINDDAENYTRFFVITKEELAIEEANRTSVILTEDTDKAGQLYNALGVFAKHSINLSKLHSQPRPGRKRLYSFHIDFDVSLTEATKLGILETIQNQGWKIQILGSYRADTVVSQA